MGVWLEPVRRTLQNLGQAEAMTRENPAIRRPGQARPLRRPLKCGFLRSRSTNDTCLGLPTDSSLRAAIAGFCGQAFSYVAARPQPSGFFCRRIPAIFAHKSSDKVRWLPAKRSRHVVSKNRCNLGVSRSGRMLPICIQLGRTCASRFLRAT